MRCAQLHDFSSEPGCTIVSTANHTRVWASCSRHHGDKRREQLWPAYDRCTTANFPNHCANRFLQYPCLRSEPHAIEVPACFDRKFVMENLFECVETQVSRPTANLSANP